MHVKVSFGLCEMGFVRVAFGALNAESHCSLAVVPHLQKTVDVPQLQYLDKAAVCPLLYNAEARGDSQVQSLDRLRYARCCIQLLKPVEIPQVQFSDKVFLDCTLLMGRILRQLGYVRTRLRSQCYSQCSWARVNC